MINFQLQSRVRRAALLLEVLISIVIMTIVLGLLGSQLAGGMKLVQDGDRQIRASELSDRMLALLELDQNLVQRVFVDQQQQGDFGDEYPGFFWRISLEPTDVEGLGQVRLDVLYNDDPENPDDVQSAKTVTTYAMLKADPGKIDLEEDFGVDPEQLGPLNEVLPTLGLDPNNLDPQALASLSPEVLLTLLPQLMPLIQQLIGGAAGPGGVPLAGSGPGGEWTIEDLMKLQEQLGGVEGFDPGAGPLAGGPGAGPVQIPLPPGIGPGDGGDFVMPNPRGGGQPGRGPGRGAGGGQGGIPGGGPGGNPNIPAGGSGPNGEWTIEDLLDLQEQLTGERGAPGDGGTPPAGGATPRPRTPPLRDINPTPGGGANPTPNAPQPPRNPAPPPPPAGGNNDPNGPVRIEPSGVDENGNPQYTIEDLLRLRDELMRRGQGGP